MSMLEADIEIPACNLATEAGWLIRKCKWIGRRAAPDRWAAKKGHVPFFLEFKRPGEELGPAQKLEIARMRAAGAIVHVVDSWEKAMEVFEL